ncbi:MAG TPA: hypothetical protein VJ085_08090 [Candidatus Acidoferrales bacterium]|nr:hypothetical protein [Candidatus Acidoferrales bacterium]
MRTTRILLVVCLLLIATGGAWAQTSSTDDAAVARLYGEFFEALRQAGAQGAIGYLRQSGSIAEDELQRLERQARRVLELNPYVGRPDSWAVVNQTEIAGSQRYRTVYALTHHDGRAVAWRLHFYRKVTGVWVFTDVQWESKYVEDFLRLTELEFAAYRRQLERNQD